LRSRPLYHATLPGPAARRVVDLAMAIDPKITIGVEHIDEMTGYRLKGRVSGTQSGSDDAFLPAKMLSMLQSDVTKVMLIGKSGSLGDIQGRLQSEMREEVGFAFSNMTLLQVVKRGVDKRKALAAVAQHYNIPQNRVIAIGDAPNDLGMIKWAGLGVAVANAWSSVKAAARHVVKSNNDDGVAEAIRKLILEA